MKRGWIVASSAFFALFCVTVWESASYALFDELGPGPGFFPLSLGVIGAALSAVLVFQTARAPSDPPDENLVPDRAAVFRVVSIIVMLAVGATLLEIVGWRLTALIMTIALLPALGARSPIAIGLFVVAASFGVFHIFYYWLKVPLPIGTFGI